MSAHPKTARPGSGKRARLAAKRELVVEAARAWQDGERGHVAQSEYQDAYDALHRALDDLRKAEREVG